MTKTSLLQSLRRAYRLAQIVDRQHRSPQEACQIWNERTSHRRYLQGSLVAAGAAAAVVIDRQFHPQPVDAAIAPLAIAGAGIDRLNRLDGRYYLAI